MKIVQLTAENVKKIRIVQIRPDGSMIQITGKNGEGKSSVLDSIYWALAGAGNVTSMPIRQGADRAVIKLELGEITVTRKFAKGEDGKEDTTTLLVESKEGARFPSPQRTLDDLLGALTFDPLEFSRMEPKKQLDTIRGLVPLEVDVDALDRENKELYDKRTIVNRDGKKLLERQNMLFAAIGAPDELPEKEIDISALMQKLEKVSQHNADIEIERMQRRTREQKITDIDVTVLGKLGHIETIKREINNLNAQREAIQSSLNDAPALPEPRDATAVRQEIGAAQELNSRIATRRQYLNVSEELRTMRQQAETFTHLMEENTRQKQAAFAAAKMPVEGLAFGDGEVYYKKVPFAQASSAEQLRVSVAMAMAMNPKLRVLRIKDGSLLDESNLALIAEMAEGNDFQVWIETINSDSPASIVMVDGMVMENR